MPLPAAFLFPGSEGLFLQLFPWVLASPLSLPATLLHALEVRLTGDFSQFLSSFRSFGSIERCSSSGSRRVAVELLKEPSCDFFGGSFRELSMSCSRGGLPLVCLVPLPLEQLFHWPLPRPALPIPCTHPPPLFPSRSLQPGDLSEAFPWLLLRTFLLW